MNLVSHIKLKLVFVAISVTMSGENKKLPSFLFVVQAKKAELKPVGNDQHNKIISSVPTSV